MFTKAALPIFLFLLASLLMSASFAKDPIFPPLEGVDSQAPITPPVYPQFQRPMAGFPQYPPAMAQAPQAVQPQKLQAPANKLSGYLGIVLDIIPSSVAAQLPQGTSQGQGVLVKKFAPNSPGETSDLRPFDIILAYGGVALNHPSQFIKFVRDDKPGRQVTLKVIRKGQFMDIPVTLGAQETPNPQEFNGLAIKQKGKNNYQAIIRYIAQNGSKQVRTYEGTREEIHNQALNAYDLPLAEREQILYATRPRKKKSNSGFGSFFPFGGNNSGGGDWMNPGKFFKF